MLVYHGSKNLFNDFDYNLIGENGRIEGNGFYFTDSLTVANAYSSQDGYIYEVEFSGKKQLSNEKITITRNNLKKVLMQLQEENEFLWNFEDVGSLGVKTVLNNAINLMFEYNNNDVDIFVELCNINGGTEQVAKIFYNLFGYDSIVIKEASWSKQSIYIAIVKDIIKIKKVVKYNETK